MPLFEKKKTDLDGCFEIFPTVRRDERGCFVKIFHEAEAKELGLPLRYAEEYFSVSFKGVLRGLHFQIPPMEHEKLVCCVCGEVLDVALDLRRSSKTYGRYVSVVLSGEKGNMLFLPKGFAHGFYTLSESATMYYKVTSVYDEKCDKGILWDSAGIAWNLDKEPVLSERDKSFVRFDEFVSPFV